MSIESDAIAKYLAKRPGLSLEGGGVVGDSGAARAAARNVLGDNAVEGVDFTISRSIPGVWRWKIGT